MDVYAPRRGLWPAEHGRAMVAWGSWLQLRHWVLLLTSLFLIACAGVLGIEDRKLDTADTYPVGGYDGCRPGADCNGCLAVHRVKCEARSVCADSAGDDCASCVCRDCVQPLSECQ